MAAQRGKAFLLAIGNGATNEVFTTIGGLRATSITINNVSVDISDKQTNSWIELFADSGGRSITITASGIFKDSAAENTVRLAAMAGLLNNYKLTFEDGSFFRGAFQIENLTYSGDNNDVVNYSISLKSSGAVVLSNM